MQIFEKNVIGVWGQVGEQWLKSIPDLVSNVSAQWGVEHLKPLPHLSYNYVFQAVRVCDAMPVIAKLSCDAIEFGYEVSTLKAYQYCGGCIPILDVDEGRQAFLMPQAIPGISLASLFLDQDDLAIAYASEVIQKLHSVTIPQGIQLPKLEDWLQCFDRPLSDALPSEHLQKAKTLSDYLLQTTKHEVLLHGDLHYDNILQHGEHWLSIDPKGIIGDPAFEVSNACVRRSGMSIMDAKMMRYRFELFAKHLDLEFSRILQWAYVQAVMSACWFVDDQGDPTFSIQLAESLDTLLS